MTESERELDAARELSERVGERLRERDDRLAVAESLTGGLICSLLTDVPGSSDYFDRGVVTYGYDSKRAELAVPREELDAHGAVSAEVARSMARGVRDRADADWGLAATGVAGPGGGTKQKPVGLVYVGVAHAAPWGSGNSFARAERYVFDGDRLAVKLRSATQALEDLLDAVERVNEGEESGQTYPE